MEKFEFPGELDYISPIKLIDKENQDDFSSFFLILAMVFNDLKSLIFVQKFVEDNYRKPEIDEISVQMGEWGGIMTHTNKLIVSTVNEFLIFLEKNKDITSSLRFSFLLKNLTKNEKANWTKIIDPNKDESSVISKIARIRSNVSFHYDHSKEELRRGFIRSFFGESKGILQHKKAYFSLGRDMRTTRFFYADAAVEDYARSLLSEKDIKVVRSTIDTMNLTIQSLLSAYIKSVK
ncbi:MAG: hypothetical protein CEO12_435 [Parcubacteria group bacterium Gr01-1014_46]|nr:MAG: hypothetical protein CEO12_435 [Parcubacteria group bacterium Gr01-1014_46]